MRPREPLWSSIVGSSGLMGGSRSGLGVLGLWALGFTACGLGCSGPTGIRGLGSGFIGLCLQISIRSLNESAKIELATPEP